MKLIWLTDLHFKVTEPVAGVETAACVDAALSHINQYYTDADLCVISGDLVDHGLETDYKALRARLDTLPMPWLPMVGNHDNRDLFRQFMVLPESVMDDFIQYVVTTPTHNLICLDTQREGRSDGEVCEERMRWLVAQIEAAADKPVYLFMHHPPMELGLPMQDFESFANREKFIEVVARYPNVKHIFAGHVHRAMCGQISGIPYATMRSVSFQAPPPYPAWTWETFKPADEAPNYGVVSINGDAVNIQYIEF